MISAFQPFKDRVILLSWQYIMVIIIPEVEFIGYVARERFAGAGLYEIMDADKTNGLHIDQGPKY